MKSEQENMRFLRHHFITLSLHHPASLHDIGSGGGEGSGNGIHSSLSRSGSFMRPARQSAFACSMRSRDEDTKFHSMKRGPIGSPPRAMTIERVSAVKLTFAPADSTSMLPSSYLVPSTSIAPEAT